MCKESKPQKLDKILQAQLTIFIPKSIINIIFIFDE